MAAAAQTEPEDAPGVQPDNVVLPPPPPPPPPEKRGLESRVAVFGLLFLCLNVFGVSCLAVADPYRYDELLREDYWIEYLTAVWFLLAAPLLFVTARLERSLFRRGVYILGGIALLFVAGEEISWGQRILGFGTPDFLLGWNEQGEFNAHNIESYTVNVVVRNLALLLCTVTCAAFFCRKDTLVGIPLPSILLVFGFLASVAYNTRGFGELDYSFLFNSDFIFARGRNLLLLFVIWALLSGQSKRCSGAVVATAAILLASWVVNRSSGTGQQPEVVEYLLGILGLCYALELLLAQAPARRRIDLLVAGLNLRERRQSAAVSNDSPNLAKAVPARIGKGLREPWLTVCALAIVCSTGLMFWQYFDARAEAADFEERYRSITTGAAGEPVVRAIFDAYLIGNELTYFKEPCDRANTEDTFFLHLIPANRDDQPEYSREYGFDNRDFRWKLYGAMSDGRCMATIPLPDYAISSIRTGQFVRDGGNIWTAEFAVSNDEFEEKYRSITTGMAGEPVVRATFDVYLIGSELTYVKNPCESADTEDVFFLHLTPANVDDLPGERRQYGFDNLDFRWAGAIRYGRCMATIRLPGYAISSIRTGQYVPDEGQIWNAEFAVP